MLQIEKTSRKTRLNVVSIHGRSGSGKDTLAGAIVENGYAIRRSFGDYIRQDLGKLGYGVPDDERLEDEEGLTYKQRMVGWGRKTILQDPLKYVNLMEAELSALFLLANIPPGKSAPLVVITDCRRPVEFEMLRTSEMLNLWAVRLPDRDGYPEMPLDCLLDGYPITPLSESPDAGTYLDQLTDHMIRRLPGIRSPWK